MLYSTLRGISRSLPLAVLAPLLASCSDNGCGSGCYNTTPYEFSAGVVSGDFTGQRFADVIALSTVFPPAWPNPSNVKAYLATAPGTYAAPVLTPDGFNPLFIASADVNGDGFMDLVSASYDDASLNVLFNNKNSPGSFNPPLVLNSPGASQVAIMDMNGDGLPDLVSADFNVSLFIQTSPGTFAAPIGLYAGGANWVALGDLNGDGVPDVALTDAVGVKVLMYASGNPAAPTYAAPVSVFTQTQNSNVVGGSVIAIADVDGDGLNDLILTDPGPTGGMSSTVNVLIQNPVSHGTFLAPVPYAIATQDRPQSIVMAHLTDPAHWDIVIGGQNYVTVLLHDPVNVGKFLQATIYHVPGANGIAVADVNGDGKLDIVVSNGVTYPMSGGVVTTHPGVLLQTSPPGSFGALQDLP